MELSCIRFTSEFYEERDVVREERRMRVESDPQGKLMEQMLATAIEAHPYRNMPGGWASDIERSAGEEEARKNSSAPTMSRQISRSGSWAMWIPRGFTVLRINISPGSQSARYPIRF